MLMNADESKRRMIAKNKTNCDPLQEARDERLS
jgi:hypothetical protein